MDALARVLEASADAVVLVKRVAEAHGWSLDVPDGTDGGARFEVRFGDEDW